MAADNQQGAKPCDCYHPLPCGMDSLCPVPMAFYDPGKSSEGIVEAYRQSR